MLQLRFAGLETGEGIGSWGSIFANKFRNQVWNLNVTDGTDGPLRITGTGQSMGAVDLVEMTDGWREQQKEKLTAALSGGANFRATLPATGAGDPETIVRLELDPASQKVSGGVQAGGRNLQLFPTQPLEGEIVELDGVPMLHLIVGWPPASGRKPTTQIRWFAMDGPEGLKLTGHFAAIDGNRSNGSELVAVQ